MTDEQVFKEISTVRDMYNTKTVLGQWDAMILGLGHILFNEKLSERATSLLEATLWETGERKMWVESGRIKL